MKTIKLGTQGLTVPVIGLRCMGMKDWRKEICMDWQTNRKSIINNRTIGSITYTYCWFKSYESEWAFSLRQGGLKNYTSIRKHHACLELLSFTADH